MMTGHAGDTSQEEPIVRTIQLSDGGRVPNHPDLPVLHYPQAIPLPARNPGDAIAARFRESGWEGIWYNGIFPYHHYHATAHEVLGIAAGAVTVQLGGEDGPRVDLVAGDVVVLPAGTGHKRVESTRDLLVIGGYPPGQYPDMKYGEPGERPEADREIALVPMPASDPVAGVDGPLVRLWTRGQG